MGISKYAHKFQSQQTYTEAVSPFGAPTSDPEALLSPVTTYNKHKNSLFGTEMCEIGCVNVHACLGVLI